MSYEDNIELWVGDFGYSLEFQCTDAKGNPFDLTDYTLEFRASEPTSNELAITGEATPVEAESGLCEYVVKNTDFTQEDKVYEAAIIATKFSGETKVEEITFGDLKIRVKKKPRKKV